MRTAVKRVQSDTSRRGTSILTCDAWDMDTRYSQQQRSGLAAAAIARWPRIRGWTTKSVTRRIVERATTKSIASSNFERFSKGDGVRAGDSAPSAASRD